MRIFNKILSAISYWTLMFIGFSFFIISTGIGIYLLTSTGDLINRIWDFIQSVVPPLEDKEPPISLITFIVEIPFITMSLIGLSIILLTQRTASAKRLARR